MIERVLIVKDYYKNGESFNTTSYVHGILLWKYHLNISHSDYKMQILKKLSINCAGDCIYANLQK